MKKHILWFLILFILTLGVAACGEVPTPDTGQTQGTPAPDSDRATEPQLEDVPHSAVPVVQEAIDDLLARNNAAERADVEVLLVEEAQWPDSCLGCPEEDEACLEVITPGYRIILQLGDATYEYHSDMENSRYCPEENVATGTDESNRLVDLVVEDLADQLGVAASAIEVVRVEPVEWRDSSLGCPQEGQSYLMVITPGYSITLEAEGQQYEYHTDMETNFVLCRDATNL